MLISGLLCDGLWIVRFEELKFEELSFEQGKLTVNHRISQNVTVINYGPS